MSYKKATHLLPQDLLLKIQEYIDGEFLYIPRAADNKKGWGETTSIRQEYCLSLKSIQRIVGQLKNSN